MARVGGRVVDEPVEPLPPTRRDDRGLQGPAPLADLGVGVPPAQTHRELGGLSQGDERCRRALAGRERLPPERGGRVTQREPQHAVEQGGPHGWSTGGADYAPTFYRRRHFFRARFNSSNRAVASARARSVAKA